MAGPYAPSSHRSRGITRRVTTLGIGSFLASTCFPARAADNGSAGCFCLQAGCSFSPRSTQTFPDLARMDDNAALGMGAIGVELTRLLQVTANPAFYDDAGSGIQGNAGASKKPLFPAMPGIPAPDGTIAFGKKCYASLQGDSAALAAIFAHEAGHLLQNKFVVDELFNLTNKDRSVVRQELHADFVCGYYAAFRKTQQSDWKVFISANLQFKFGDRVYANPMHHGTPEERRAAVMAGVNYGESVGDLLSNPPENVARAGLSYVADLTLDKKSQPSAC